MDKQTSAKYTALCRRCGEEFEPSSFQLDCDECCKTFIQNLIEGLKEEEDDVRK